MNDTTSDMLLHFSGLNKTEEEAFQTLKKILHSRQFYIKPKKRDINLNNSSLKSSIKLDVHMCCFTETPIQFIGNHMKKYGKFGIGMKLEWGIRNRGQNVIYYDNNNPTIYGEILLEILEEDFDYTNKTFTKFRTPWIHTLVGLTEDIENRHEREWRFIGRTIRIEDIDGYIIKPRQIYFGKDDIVCLICPEKYMTTLEAYINSLDYLNGWSFKLLISEQYYEDIA